MSDSGDSAVVRSSALIANNLSTLVKEKCMISVFLGGKDTLLTAIIQVNLKDKTIIFDSSPSEKLNAKLLVTRRVKFSTVFNGIQVAFSGESISKIKHGGYDAFIMPFPDSLYWFDRRGAYRVHAPITNNSSFGKIRIPPPPDHAKPEQKFFYEQLTGKVRKQLLEKIQADERLEIENFQRAYAKMTAEEKSVAKIEWKKREEERLNNPIVPDEDLVNVIQLKMFDLSMTGCAMLNFDEIYSPFLSKGSVFEDCELVIPDFGEIPITLEIMMQRAVEHPHEQEQAAPDTEDEEQKPKPIKHKFEEFIGFKFIDTKQSSETVIFRYIQALDRLLKKK